MATRRETAIDVFKTLPIELRKRLRVEDLTDLAALTDAAMAKEHVEIFYRGCYSLLKELNRWKSSRNLCTGMPNCMKPLGKNPEHKTCPVCRKKLREQRLRGLNGETRKIVLSDYGLWRAKERKAIRDAKLLK